MSGKVLNKSLEQYLHGQGSYLMSSLHASDFGYPLAYVVDTKTARHSILHDDDFVDFNIFTDF